MVQLDLALVERFTGQSRVRSLEVADAEMQTARAAHQRIDNACRLLKARISVARRQQANLERRLWLAKIPARSGIEGWVILLVLSVLISAGSSVLMLKLSGSTLALIAATSMPFLLMVLAPVVFPSDLASLSENLTRSSELRSAAQRDLATSAPMVVQCEQRLSHAIQLRNGLIRARDFPLNRLLGANLESMSGSDFEAYLAEVFLFLGYHVETTGRSGDQGVDLVIVRYSVRIAVQAKCYSGSVGNAAVQQVYTGMRMYNCQKCIVIAASAFTRSAHEAAKAVGCMLIGRENIPQLIRGQLLI
jgi:HJR/Mrr/RecB family endonuclease